MYVSLAFFKTKYRPWRTSGTMIAGIQNVPVQAIFCVIADFGIGKYHVPAQCRHVVEPFGNGSKIIKYMRPCLLGVFEFDTPFILLWVVDIVLAHRVKASTTVAASLRNQYIKRLTNGPVPLLSKTHLYILGTGLLGVTGNRP